MFPQKRVEQLVLYTEEAGVTLRTVLRFIVFSSE